MQSLRLTHTIVGIGIWLVSWFPATASEPTGNSAVYDVVTTRVMYQPTEPFHITDMRYPDKSDFETRTVTIYQPYQNGQALHNRPVVFFVHGGAWVDEYADWYTTILTPVLTVEQGWVVVNVDYRLTSNQVYLADEYCRTYDTCDPAHATKAAWYPDNIQDVAAAFAWTVQNIAAYGGDAQNIFLFGHSAGGHLVSLLATHSDYRALRGQMRGVISMSGVYSFTELSAWSYPFLDQTFHGGHTDTAALNEASPGTYVVAGESFPPFYVLHCQYDLVSLPEQAIAFRNKLEALSNQVDWSYLLGYTHVTEMTAIANGQETVTQSIVQCITTHIRKILYLPLILNQSAE
jgi:acetyl esterase/lipase